MAETYDNTTNSCTDNLAIRIESYAKLSDTYKNPIWEMIDEMNYQRPYELTDFKEECFIPDL